MTTTPQAYQERIAAILAEAQDRNLSLYHVIPAEVQDHFQGLTEDEDTPDYVSELEKMKKKNAELESELTRAKAEQAHLQTDLTQATKKAEFYKSLMDEAEGRAKRFQIEMRRALQRQTAAEEVEQKIKRLERENCDLMFSKEKLAEDFHTMKELLDKIQDKHLASLEDKEQRQMLMEKQLKEKDAQYKAIQKDSSAIEDKYHEVMTTLDAAIDDLDNDINIAKSRARVAEQQRNVMYAELQPLRRFYAHANDIIDMYRGVFRQLLNTDREITCSRDFDNKLSTQLQIASDECEAFRAFRAANEAVEGLPRTEHYDQVGDIAKSAQNMHSTLKAIGKDVTQFLWALERRTDLRSMIRGKFKILH